MTDMGLMQMITISIPLLYWAFILSLSFLGVWKLIEIMIWIYSNSGVHTPSMS